MMERFNFKDVNILGLQKNFETKHQTSQEKYNKRSGKSKFTAATANAFHFVFGLVRKANI